MIRLRWRLIGKGGYLTPHDLCAQDREPLMIPDQMTAIAVEGGKGPASALTATRIDTPRPGPGQILIRVRAAGVNRPDVMQRQGNYPPPPGAPSTIGLEVAGEVVALGPGALRWKVGDQVAALLGGGGYAEYAVVDARHALPIPGGLDHVQAAALPETVFTVFTNVFELGRLKSGETLLLHGATSGIGVAAIQMAKAAGAKVIATSRGADKAARAKALGADLAIDTSAGDFVEPTLAAGGADVVLDMVGGDYVARDFEALNTGGRIVMIATQAGANVEVNLGRIMQKRAVLTGSTLRPRDADEKARLAAEVERVVWPWIAAGKVKTIVDTTFPLADAAKAHARLESADHVGKIVLVT
jgi:putative PIG3 family NAD(P)H quinone oxidoreductase